MKERKGGIYTHRSLKDALDLLLMSRGDPDIFTYSSGFGAFALQIKQVRDNFCSNWSSLDWGKREWPPIGTLGEGGVRGVKFRAKFAQTLPLVDSNKIHIPLLLRRNLLEFPEQFPELQFVAFVNASKIPVSNSFHLDHSYQSSEPSFNQNPYFFARCILI